jgi:phospholipase C
MALALSVSVGVALGASAVSAAGLEQIEHVVLFMQENRAFNHVIHSYTLHRELG